MQKPDPVAVSIKRIIQRKGLLQGNVALRAGFTVQQFSFMMTGRKIIRAFDVLAIAEAMEVEVADIFDGAKVFTQEAAPPAESGDMAESHFRGLSTY